MNEKDRRSLLGLARDSITSKFRTTEPDFESTKHLQDQLGVFVTLHKNHELRGCVGYTEGVVPLCEATAELARAAAFRDSRFAPLQSDEVKDLQIEISVLSVPQKLDCDPEKYPENIRIGTDGLLIKGFSTGILLPQVATEQGFNSIQFLECVCQKAGLPDSAYKDPNNSVYIFQAEIFSE